MTIARSNAPRTPKGKARWVAAVLVFVAGVVIGWFWRAAGQDDQLAAQRARPAAFEPTAEQREWARTLGSSPVTEPSKAEIATRQSSAGLRLLEVTAATAPGGTQSPSLSGSALIAIGSEPARMVKTGTLLEPGLALAAVTARSAVLVRMDTGERFVLELPETRPTPPGAGSSSGQQDPAPYSEKPQVPHAGPESRRLAPDI